MTDWCNCDIRPEERNGPCPTHERDARITWLATEWPRYAAATTANDPFIVREYWPADAADIPEFAVHRAALSPQARQWFDRDWEDTAGFDWCMATEQALKIRDDGHALVEAHERNAVRAHLAQAGRDEEYPIGTHCDDFEEYTTTASVEDLLAEADLLAELARRALAVERLLRSHAAGR